MKTKEELNKVIEDFLNSLDSKTDLRDNLLNLVDVDNIDLSNPYNSIFEMIQDNEGFDCEVIYYANAIKYLMENDPSLRQSLQLAADLCYSPENLNSEILASLLKSENVREDFSELQNEIESFFSDLEEIEEE